MLLFTGATGKIGKPLLAAIRSRHPSLRIRIATPDAPPQDAGTEWMRTDFTDPATDFAALVAGCDSVFHFGAETQPGDSHFETVNVEATRRLAEAAEASGEVRRFLYTSSTMAYGYSPTRHAPDEAPLAARPYFPARDPLRAYGLSKYESEIALRACASRVQYVVLRPTLVSERAVTRRLFGNRSLASNLWQAHRIWHHINVTDAAEALVHFADPALWERLPAFSYFNFSADDPDLRSFDVVFGPRGNRPLRAALLAVVPPLDMVKDWIKFRHLRFAWPYPSIVFRNDGLRRLGIAPKPDTESLAGPATRGD